MGVTFCVVKFSFKQGALQRRLAVYCGLPGGLPKVEDKLGARDKILDTKVARRVRAGQTFPQGPGILARRRWRRSSSECPPRSLCWQRSSRRRGRSHVRATAAERSCCCGRWGLGCGSALGPITSDGLRGMCAAPVPLWQPNHRRAQRRSYHRPPAESGGRSESCCHNTTNRPGAGGTVWFA